MPAESIHVSSIDTATAPRWSRSTVLSGISAASALFFCISANTGVSCSQRRKYIAPMPNTPPSRKGTRQPQASNSSGLKMVLMPVATSEPSRMPPVRPAVKVPQA
jgi:hypothetical protein